MYVLALDVGTSAVKAAVVEAASLALAGPVAQVAYELDHPTPDAAEVPAERLWQAVSTAARQAARQAPEPDGIGLSVLTPGLVLLDAADRPLTPIWTHLDRRARPAARHIQATVGDEFLATVGNRPLPGGITVTCYRQLLAIDPYLFRRVRSYLHVNGWLALRLTGERAFDLGNASVTGLFDTMTDRKWSERWCRHFEVEPEWLPAVRDGRTTIGALRSAVAAELGVPPGLPVQLGAADTTCAMLAADMKPGDLLHLAGTTQVLATLCDRPVPSPSRLTRLFGVGDRYLQVVHNPVGGVALDWLHRLCFRDQSAREFFEQTVPQALTHTTQVTLDPPYLGGDRLEIEAHRAAFRDLTLASDRLDLLSAVLDAMRRKHREALAELGGSQSFSRVFLAGGAEEVVQRLLPEYTASAVTLLADASLRGAARLFNP